ncbi:hypothetical protein LTR28_007434, partial [Elasticomyces elasticus]
MRLTRLLALICLYTIDLCPSASAHPTQDDHDPPQADIRSYPETDIHAHIPFTPQPPSLKPSRHHSAPPDHNIFFADYQPLSVIHPWLRLLSSLFTTHVRLINIGTSYEGRSIPALRVGVHPKNNAAASSNPRKTVLVTGGAHAREWISVSTVNYLAYSLITGYGQTRAVTELVEAFDWVFVPTLNPDGYAYSWDRDRLWRKNRQPTPHP